MDVVNRWLIEQWHINVPDEWLRQCIDWIQNQNENDDRLDCDTLKSMVLDQWLICDLREIGSACLPEGLANIAKYMLSGAYCLQINAIMDVSKPYYGQLQQLRGTENENVLVTAETQVPAKSRDSKTNRMLMLSLTDGVQDVKAIEYCSIPELNSSLTPGTKVIVRGNNVLCRYGVLMLKKGEISILGGEVESLMQENCQLNMLKRKLGLSTSIKEELTSLASDDANYSSPSQQNSLPNTNINTEFKNDIDWDDQWDDNIFEDSLQLDTRQCINADLQQSVVHQHQRQSTNQKVGDSLRITPVITGQLNSNCQPQNASHRQKEPVNQTVDNIHFTFASDKKSNLSTSNVLNQLTLSHTYKQPYEAKQNSHAQMLQSDDYESYFADELDLASREVKNNSVDVSIHSSQALKPPASHNNRDYFNSKFINSAPLTRAAPVLIKQQTIDLFSSPFTYLSKLSNTCFDTSSLQIRVKAYISTFLGKLEHNEGQFWSLKVKINDGTGTLDVQLGNEMLAAIIGFSAAKCLEMREASKTNKTVRSTLLEALKSCQEYLTTLSCCMIIEFNSQCTDPHVIKCMNLTAADFDLLKLRNEV